MEQKQFNFDVSRGGVQHRLSVRQGDTKSRTVTAKFFSGDTQIEFSSAYIRALRPSGAQLYAPCEVQDNEVLYTLTSEDLSEGGVFECEFELHNGEQILTSPKFLVDCTALLYDGEGVESSDSYKAYQTALLKLENMKVSAVSGDETGVDVKTTDTEISMVFTLRDGKDGVIIDSVTYKGRNTADTANVYAIKVVKSDGTLFKSFDFEAKDGKKGEKGDPGADGYSPKKGLDYWTAEDTNELNAAIATAFQAADNADHAAESTAIKANIALDAAIAANNAADAANNATAELEAKVAAGDFKGDKGDKGDTPVKGVDYFTDEDKDEIGVERGTGNGSVRMRNTNSIVESDDANTGIPVYSEGTPQANGIGSFAIGAGTKAEGHASTAEGINTTAGYVRDDESRSRNVGSHAEGIHTYAKSSGSHAEGFYTNSFASNSHTEGFQTTVNSNGWSGHAEGRETVVNEKAGHAEGYLTQTNGTEAHAEGMSTKAEGDRSHAEGENTIAGAKVGDTFDGITVTDTNRANYRAAHAEGIETKAYKKGSHAEGIKTVASGEGAHAEGTTSANGTGNTASGKGSHAEGGDTTASGIYGHAEGDRTTASGSAGHAEGVSTFGKYRSHAEGEGTIAGAIVGEVVYGVTVTASNINNYRAAHAEGLRSIALATGSHAEGKDTIANGQFAHAEGAGSKASGVASHAGGTSTIAQWGNSTVVGKYNKTTNLSNTNSDPLFIVGNGTSASARKNAFEVFTDGSAYVDGKKVLAADIYYITWESAILQDVIELSGITIKDSENNLVTNEDFPAILQNNLNTTNIQFILYGNVPAKDEDNISVKCITSSISHYGHPASMDDVYQISGSVGYYYAETAKAKYTQEIKINVSFDGTITGYITRREVNSYFPCLIEGTEITMADNTTKPVEQVKAGDIVLSYNPITKEKTSAVVIDAYKTGESNKFDVYSFENGKHLTAYGIHGFYANELGYVKNLQDISKTNELIGEDLEATYLIVKRQMFFHGTPKARYNLIVSNNLYFANGILLGHSPWQKGQYYINRNGMNALPEAVKTAFQTEIDKYNAYQSFMNNPAYHAEVAESYKTLSNAINEIKIYKDKLSKSDYKVQKYTEGVLSEEEWEEAKTKRAAWRQAVNDNEQLRNESKALVDAIIAKYRNGVTAKSLFEECCTIDNAMLEAVKACFISSNSTVQSAD